MTHQPNNTPEPLAEMKPAELELRVGRTYRAKRPAAAGTLFDQFVNDRTILWIGLWEVQYDGPSVGFARNFPKVTIEAFRKWAARDVTDELPKDKYAPWPIAKATGSD